ncbi:hypothetical protein [Streptomyces sp. F001]|uniref:hypothetical protein n=1 Tax=Streptomyces sp. F001 TaxID=1510026 RepID=UPI0019D2157E|nr:hypothetical protein [Streptomyces sp. F001]
MRTPVPSSRQSHHNRRTRARAFAFFGSVGGLAGASRPRRPDTATLRVAVTGCDSSLTRITSGNFRLTSRLVAQIERVMDINQLTTVTAEVVEAARESLVVGVL